MQNAIKFDKIVRNYLFLIKFLILAWVFAKIKRITKKAIRIFQKSL